MVSTVKKIERTGENSKFVLNLDSEDDEDTRIFEGLKEICIKYGALKNYEALEKHVTLEFPHCEFADKKPHNAKFTKWTEKRTYGGVESIYQGFETEDKQNTFKGIRVLP